MPDESLLQEVLVEGREPEARAHIDGCLITAEQSTSLALGADFGSPPSRTAAVYRRVIQNHETDN